MLRSDFAKLYAMYKSFVTDEFINSSAFRLAESEPDTVEKLEKFKLPEIMRLIVYSEKLLQYPWAAGYKRVRDLYIMPNEATIIKHWESYPNEKEYKVAEIPFLEPVIIRKMLDIISRRTSQKSLIKTKIKEGKKMLAELKKEKDSPADEKEKIEAQIKYEKELLAELEAFLKQWKNVVKVLSAAAENNTDSAVEGRRETAYNVFFKTTPEEVIFLQQFLQTGNVTDEYQAKFRDEGFLRRVLSELSNGSYIGYAAPIVMKLYEQGALDIQSEMITTFILSQKSVFADYLSEHFANAAIANSEDRALLEQICQLEVSKPSAPLIFGSLWNKVSLIEHWNLIMSICIQESDENPSAIATHFLRGVNEDTASVISDLLIHSSEYDLHISQDEVCHELLANDTVPGLCFVLSVLSQNEQNMRSTGRKIRTLERKLNSQPQEAFKALYEPIEKLELLATNLRSLTTEINTQQVAHELIGDLMQLRGNLRALGVMPACENEEDWQNHKALEFDENTHRIQGDIPNNAKIELSTMGFAYKTDTGEERIYPALVHVKEKVSYGPSNPRTATKKKKQSGPNSNEPEWVKEKKGNYHKHGLRMNSKQNISEESIVV